jgi:5-(aminomethyl)-3-furanmethanol phosphate kinase
LDAVIKVGGSLAVDPAVLRALCLELSRVAVGCRVVVVPGGGEFADVVRDVDGRFGLGSGVSHRMAVLGMDQFGLLLSGLIPGCRVACSLGVVGGLAGSGRGVVLLPSRLVFRARSLVASWDVTSDSIAAYVAGRLGVGKLVLVTDVDGVFSGDPKVDAGAELLEEVSASGLLELGVRTSVDRFLPRVLLKFGLGCFVVNGRFPERVSEVLAGKSTVCTHIMPK